MLLNLSLDGVRGRSCPGLMAMRQSDDSPYFAPTWWLEAGRERLLLLLPLTVCTSTGMAGAKQLNLTLMHAPRPLPSVPSSSSYLLLLLLLPRAHLCQYGSGQLGLVSPQGSQQLDLTLMTQIGSHHSCRTHPGREEQRDREEEEAGCEDGMDSGQVRAV